MSFTQGVILDMHDCSMLWLIAHSDFCVLHLGGGGKEEAVAEYNLGNGSKVYFIRKCDEIKIIPHYKPIEMFWMEGTHAEQYGNG